jgi:integrase
MPECMAWRDVQKVMLAAVEHAASMVPALAIGFFAGLRPAELRQLDWRDVDIEARRITVLPAVAKKRRARHVYMEENLAAWLLPYRQPSGVIAPEDARWWGRLKTIRKKAGVKWIKNAMRHSYASHHLVKYGDAAKTAFQLGHHRDTSMLFEHYRALVKPEDGKEYFDIRPAEAGRVLAFKATA